MLDEKLKQRLVGASVLIALAIIFLPSFFHKDERVSIDTTTQIPPAPVIAPVVIPQPVKPNKLDKIAPPPADQLFQPKVIENELVDTKKIDAETVKSAKGLNQKEEKGKKANTLSKSTAFSKPKTDEKPRLTKSGVPVGWVVQVASLKSKDSAKKLTAKLIKSGFKAYEQSVKTDQGEFFRVFVGPFIDKSLASGAKQKVDKQHKVKSRILRFNPVSGN
ncbi:MAG: SPOR domain-containing protein [Cellvibrionaceae bacterium]